MKKRYMQPETAMMEIELQRMIAASNEVAIDPTETSDPNEADSRTIDDLFEMPIGL